MIYHLVTPHHWLEFEHRQDYFAQTFEEEGFIHCSTAAQVAGVLQRYFKDNDTVYLLHIDEHKLLPELLFEQATNQEFFPHVFGGINKSAIIKMETYHRQANGEFAINHLE
jgi:uncharacterized protein (DUF952 family)